jgi:imidazoleglycerol-phosphate dehydratase
VLGQAVRQALGDMRGITRYASLYMPMDETLTRVAIDVSGRPVLVFKVDFPRQDRRFRLVTSCASFSRPFAMNAGVTLHVETLYGDNATTSRKAASRVLRERSAIAFSIDPAAATEIPSTKGSLGA